ncbi:MAG TPA: hypothetical protein VIJ38_19720, partial [Acidobacteriaceae bacterium]
PQDGANAAFWFRKAAEQGEAVSQILLGSCYERGEGVPKNNAQAYFWMDLGVASGRLEGDSKEDATKLRDHAAAQLTKEALYATQDLARVWSESHPAQ